jgi:CBS domain-containing protein
MRVSEVMTRHVELISPDQSIQKAAQCMCDMDVGVLPVSENDRLVGMVTDRDIAVRAVAEGRDAESTTVGEIATTDAQAIEPDASVDDALRMMREHDIRRLPVVKNGRPVGIVSLGDLAVEREPDSTLADISAAAPDQ